MRSNKDRLTKFAVFASVMLLTFYVVPTACLYYGMRGQASQVTILSRVSKSFRLEFPRSTRLIDATEQTGIRPYVLAKIQFERSQLATFINQPGLAATPASDHNDLLDDEDMFPLLHDMGWRLGSVRTYDSLVQTTVSPKPEYVLIDLDDQKIVTVYLATEEA